MEIKVDSLFDDIEPIENADDIIAMAQLIEESGSVIKAIQMVSFLMNISLVNAKLIVDFFINNKSLHISFNEEIK